MRGAILATAAAFAGTAVADIHARRGHEGLHHRALHNHQSSSAIPEEECGCYTEVVTYWGEPTTIPLSVPTTTSTPVSVPTSTVTSETTSTVESTSYSTITVTATSASPVESSSEVPTEAPSEVPSETPEVPTTASAVETSSQSPSETPAVTLPTGGVTSFTETGTYTIPATTLTVTDSTTVCGATTTNLPSGSHTYGGVTTIVETATTVTCPYATVKPSGSTVTSVIETTTYVCPSAGTYTIAPTTTYVPTSTVVVYPTPETLTPGTYTNTGSTVTVTRTDEVYYCPYTNGNEPTTAPAVATTSAVPTTAAPSTTTAVPSTSSATSGSATSVPTGASAQMGMTFTPYNNDGSCMDKSTVLEQVGMIKEKGFSHVRVYGTDCHTLEYVGDSCKTHGLKMIIGVFIDGTGIEAARPQIKEITSWGQWDLVSLVAVGNEAVNQQICSASELASFISDAASAFSAAGYTGQVTTAEPIDTWLANGATLCPVVDVLGANLHPFFNAEFSASEAGTLVSNQIRDLKQVCTGKDVINLETGWPSGGDANGKAIPSKSEQKIAIKSLLEKVGDVSVFFSYTDDAWKAKNEYNPYNVETHWGCLDLF
ncbi:putative cell wall glucanase (Scw11) [Aspergillus stella-maris]|uniref:putative cell wall glucanase (Scw11) n=1 Tax=Aspergillus stella-maris TaxID=1810926 RepID=UPI003CCDD331